MDELTSREMLEQEIKEDFEVLTELIPGDEKYSKAVDDVVKLYKLKIEEDKNSLDYNEKYEEGEKEIQLKKAQLEEQIKDRYFRLGVDVAGILLPLMFYGVWMKKGFKFEETGTFTSTTFRGLFSRFRPTRK